MPSPILKLACIMHYAPQPSILRGASAFERSLKGNLVRESEATALPVILSDLTKEHQITISARSFEFAIDQLERIDRFSAGAKSLMAQLIKQVSTLAPREVELRALLTIPIPDATRSLGGYAVARFTWPRKIELRPEELGVDHFLPNETGVAHLRLSTHINADGHEIRLFIGNKHDRLSADPEVIEPAYALCLRGIHNILRGLASPAYQRVLQPLMGEGAGHG